MNRYIKFLVTGAITIAAALTCSAAELESISSIDLDTAADILTVTGYNISEKYSNISYEVIKSGIEWGDEYVVERTELLPGEDGYEESIAPDESGTKKLSDFDFRTENIMDYLDAFGQVVANPGSSYTIVITDYERDELPDFRIRFGKDEFVYFSPSTLNGINNATTAEELKIAICENAYIWNKLSDECETWMDSEEKETIYWNEFFSIKTEVLQSGDRFKVPAEIIKAGESALNMSMIKSAVNTVEVEKLIEYCEKYTIEESNSYDIYSSVGDFKNVMNTKQKNALLNYLAENRNTIKSIDDFINVFNEKVVLYAVKDSESKHYINIVLKKSDILTDSFMAEYRAYSETKQIDICEILADNNKLYETKEKLVEAIENAATPKGGGSSGTAGGGSSKPSGSIGGVSAPKEPKPENKIEYIDISDVEWAHEAIEYLTEKNITEGRGNGIFDPHAQITREEFVKMLVTALDIYDKTATTDFKDVEKTAWYYTYVASGVKNNLINGVGDNYFGTGRVITRQEMAVLLHRAGVKSGVCPESSEQVEYSDASEIDSWAVNAANTLRACGIMSGDGNNRFAPLESTTRAQAAKAVYELMKRMEAGI